MFGLDELFDLIDDLRVAGYEIGTQQYISAQDLLLTLATRGLLPNDPRELHTWLAPILCSSPKEQDHFYKYYEHWLARRPHLMRGVVKRDAASSKSSVQGPAAAAKGRFIFTRQRLLAAVAALLVMAGIGMGLYIRFVPRTVSGRIVDADSNQPLPKARVQFAGQNADSDEQGVFKFNYRRKNTTESVEVQLNEYEPQVLSAGAARFRTSEDLGDIPLTKASPPPISEIDTQTIVPPVPAPTPQPPQENFFTRNFSKIRVAVLVLPFVVFAAWWLWRKYRQRTLLQKLSSAGDPHLKKLAFKGLTGQLYRGQTFRRIAQDLRRHRRRASREVDAQLTVEATVLKAGLFVPFYASRKTLPEYLALIDRASLRDQQARLEDELLNRLVEDNVFVDRFYFNGDPRTCRTENKQASFLTLSDLAARFPDHRLVIFGDGSGFIDPLTGQPQQWLDLFSPWLARAVVTPESRTHWSYREWALSESGFAVLPAGGDGLAALVEVINSGVLPRSENDSSPPLPALLQENSGRWLERYEAQPQVTTRLCDELRLYLGAEGFRWLCACAVYPTLSWELTLYFGYKLLGQPEPVEKKLLSLVRLIWFRHGDMPDWLRSRFLSEMSPESEIAVRGMLEDLLISLLENPASGIELEIATRREAAATRGWRKFFGAVTQRLRQWKRRAKLRRFLRTLPEENSLRDHVFLTFMSGRKPRKLDVSVPALLRRVLYPEGQSSLGLRTATAFAMAAIFSVAGWLLVNARRPVAERTDLIAGASPTPYVPASPEQSVAPSPQGPLSYYADPANSSPTPLPVTTRVDSLGTIPSVPNGAVLQVLIPADLLIKNLTLEKWELRQLTVRLTGVRAGGTPEARGVQFRNLPSGTYQLRVAYTNNSWGVFNINLKEGETQRLLIDSNSETSSPSPTPPVIRGPTLPVPATIVADPLLMPPVRSAPDNSNIVRTQTNDGGYIETRTFRDEACAIQKIEIVYDAQNKSQRATINYRYAVSSGGQNFAANAQFFLSDKCASIVAKFPPFPATPVPTPVPTRAPTEVSTEQRGPMSTPTPTPTPTPAPTPAPTPYLGSSEIARYEQRVADLFSRTRGKPATARSAQAKLKNALKKNADLLPEGVTTVDVDRMTTDQLEDVYKKVGLKVLNDPDRARRMTDALK